MPVTSSPLSDILTFISQYWVVILIVLIWIARMIGSASRGSTKPPAGGPRPVMPSAAPPPPRPTTLPRPQPAAQPRQPQPAGGQRFRPQPQGARPGQQPPARAGSSAARMAQKRAEIEWYTDEEKALEASAPQALGAPLTSASATGAPAGTLFDQSGPLGGPGVGPSLLRAIVLAEALGRPRFAPPRMNKRPPADSP